MNSAQILFGQIAALLAVIQVIPYVLSILKGETKPSRASYGIWAIIHIIEVTAYVTKWLFLILAINALIIFALSFKYGMGGFNKFDLACLALAGLAIVLWVVTDNPTIAVYLAVLAGSIGFLPTVKKSYSQPWTENTLSWCIYLAATLLNACALTTLAPVIALPPLASLFFASIVVILLFRPRKQASRT